MIWLQVPRDRWRLAISQQLPMARRRKKRALWQHQVVRPSQERKAEPKATGGSDGGEASDDDLLDEETQSDKAAGNITKENKATEAAPEPPIEKALREVEIEVQALGDKGQALLDSLDDMSKVSHPEIDLARYLKQAAGISKKLHGIKSSSGKKHDAFIANMRSSIEKVMRVLNKCAEKLAEHNNTKKFQRQLEHQPPKLQRPLSTAARMKTKENKPRDGHHTTRFNRFFRRRRGE